MLGMSSLIEIERMTFWEYELRMKAHSRMRVEKEYYIHLEAWVNRAVNSADKKGKYKYTRFNKFFDIKKRLRELEGVGHREEVSGIAKSYMKYIKGGVKDK